MMISGTSTTKEVYAVARPVDKLEQSFDQQIEFQKDIFRIAGNLDIKLPQDLPEHFRNQVILMLEELGELLKSDKRWRENLINTAEQGDKLEELADVFIVAFNLAILSGYDYQTIERAIKNKIKLNQTKLEIAQV